MTALSLSQKVLVTGIAPAAVCAVGMVVVYGALDRSVQTNAAVVHTNEVLAAAHDLMSNGLAAQAGERGYVITGSRAHLDAFTKASQEFQAGSRRLAKMVEDNPPQVALVGRMSETFARWRTQVAVPVIEARRTQSPETVHQLSDLLEQLNLLQDAAEAALAARQSEAARAQWQSRFKHVRDLIAPGSGDIRKLHDGLAAHEETVAAALATHKAAPAAASTAALQAQVGVTLVQAQKVEEKVALLIKDGPAGQLTADLQSAFATFVERERQLLAQRKANSLEVRNIARNFGAVAAGAACIFAVIIAGLLSSRLGGALASLRKAADAVANGDLSARADVEGDDQLSIVASRFNDMALRLALRDRENDRMSKLSEMLIASHDADEAASIIGAMLSEIFPDTSGALYVTDPSRALIEPVASWKIEHEKISPFEVSQCWAFRRGQVHLGRENPGALGCKHVPEGIGDYICIPLVAQGEALSIVHLRPNAPAWQQPQDRARLVALGKTAAERIAVALSNLRLRERLRDQSVRDPLTGLFNRRYLEETLERELARASREQSSVGVVVLDIDHFKRFNDTFGHQAGDLVLREVGRTLMKGLRKQDVACRYGGEELVLVLPGAALEDTHMRAQNLCDAIRGLALTHEGRSLGQITASFGVSAFPVHAQQSAALVRLADEALYAAKTSGRDRVVVATRTSSPAAIASVNR